MQTLLSTLQAVECNLSFAHSFVSQKLCQCSGQTLLPHTGDAIHPALDPWEQSGSRDYPWWWWWGGGGGGSVHVRVYVHTNSEITHQDIINFFNTMS